jgi:hypothetical protein
MATRRTHVGLAEPATLAAPLRLLAERIDSGEITAGPIARAYLAGALAALDALDGRRGVELPDLDR